MSPDAPASGPSPNSRPRPSGNGETSGGDRSRGRRRSGRGGRGRGGSGEGQAPGQVQGQSTGQSTGQVQGQSTGQAQPRKGGDGRTERRGEPRGDARGRGDRRTSEGAPQGGDARRDRPRGERGNRGEGGGGGRPAGRGAPVESGKGSSQAQAQQQEAARAKRREQERDADPTPNLSDWSFEHLGYTAWMAHAQVQPIRDPRHSLRSYIVDIHAGEDAVNPRLWPEIAPFLKLETSVPGPEAGAKSLAEKFRALAAELGLRPAADYLAENPPPEVSVSSPVQAALDTAIPLDLDTEQEDIDVMNEGRKGAPIRRPGE
jgi:hypothetical protein